MKFYNTVFARRESNLGAARTSPVHSVELAMTREICVDCPLPDAPSSIG